MALRILLHAPTVPALARARGNLANLLAARPDAEVELVANAAAAAAALDRPDPGDPCLVLCANSLRRSGRDAPKGVRVVAAAVLHLAERQAEGWVYIRA